MSLTDGFELFPQSLALYFVVEALVLINQLDQRLDCLNLCGAVHL